MNKSQELELYERVVADLQQILKLVDERPHRKRLMRRLNHILDIIGGSALSGKHKAKLIEMVEAINRKMQQCCTPAKEPPSSVKKTKRYSSSKKANKEMLIRERVRYSDLLKEGTDDHPDNSRTITDDHSPAKGEYQLRSLQIKNQILEQQVQLLKDRVQKARSNDLEEEGGQAYAVLQTELREANRKQQSLVLRLNDATKELAQRDAKVEQLTYQNEKLTKLLRLKEQEVKDSSSRHERSVRQLESKLDRMKRYELQARAFQAVKESLASGSSDQQLRDIVRKYKTLIR